MNRILLLTIPTILSLSALPQGSWNIGYIEIDSINSNYAGKQVKIDFKRNSDISIDKGTKWVRDFVEPEDTGRIEIEGNTIELIERRKIYVDHGDFEEQYLECLYYDDSRLLRIYDSEIIEVKNDLILFKLNLEIYTKKKGKATGAPDKKTIQSWIGKEKLDGVMFKN